MQDLLHQQVQVRLNNDDDQDDDGGGDDEHDDDDNDDAAAGGDNAGTDSPGSSDASPLACASLVVLACQGNPRRD